MSTFNPDDQIRVVAVCDNEARVYEALDRGSECRSLVMVEQFATRGAAALWAQEYEERERGALKRRSH